LGETVDIHSGGADLVFPHHENERAQSQCANGRPLAKYWLHNGFLTIRNERGEEEKMSKSLGNDLRIDQILQRFDPMTVRAFLLSAHYRSPLVYSESALSESAAALDRLSDALDTARKLLALAGGPQPASRRHPPALEQAAEIRQEFLAGMDDDFNTPRAMGALFRGVNEIHEIRQKERASGRLSPEALDALASLVETVEELAGVLGLAALRQGLGPAAQDSLVEPLIALLISVRDQARKAKAYDLADSVRGGLENLGVALEDHPQGTIWKRK
jgi:cysteinyl-tRNA synthetase